MKRLSAFILAAFMLFAFTACDSGSNNGGNNNGTNGTGSGASTNNGFNKKEEMTFTETVLVDTADCTVKVTDIDPEGVFGYTLKLTLENKSSDATYNFNVFDAAVNGIAINPFYVEEVAAGKKANSSLAIDDAAFIENGVGDYTDIELNITVSEAGTFDEYIVDETVHIYPYGESKATVFTRKSQPTDNVIMDNEYATVTVMGYDTDENFGYFVNVFILNKSDKEIRISVEEASINGFMADPYFSTSIGTGKCTFDWINWTNSDLEENNITDIEEIEFTLEISDPENWFETLVSETVTLNP